MKAVLASCACLAFSAVFADARDIRFAERFVNVADGEIVVETGPGDVLVFDGGVFAADGKPLLIIAETIRIDAPTAILSHALDSAPSVVPGEAGQGPSGANGGAWGCETRRIWRAQYRFCNSNGQEGRPGLTGATGGTGANGAAIEFLVDTVQGESLLLVVGNGQTGGEGQRGGRGGTGGIGENGQNRGGDVICRGQNRRLNGGIGGRGGTGGTGGQGGMGGAGSTVILSASLERAVVEISSDDVYDSVHALNEGADFLTADFPVIAVSVGGRGGVGGKPGGRGTGGRDGNAGKSSHCGGGGDPGRPGDRGDEGLNGLPGDPGAAGVVLIDR